MDRIVRRGLCVFRVVDFLGFKRGFGFIRYFCGGGGAGADQGTAAGELRLLWRVDPFKTADGYHHGQRKYFVDVFIVT